MACVVSCLLKQKAKKNAHAYFHKVSKASTILANPVASRKAWMLFKSEHTQVMYALFFYFAGLWLMHLQQLNAIAEK